MECCIVSLTFDPKKEVVTVYDTHDMVERDGYVPNDKKIDTFIQTGMVLSSMHMGGDEYELQGAESDFEADTPEFREELTKDAESYDNPPLEQYMDKITAEETLATAELALKGRENQKKGGKRVSSETDTKEIVKAIKDGFSSLKTSADSADSPKE